MAHGFEGHAIIRPMRLADLPVINKACKANGCWHAILEEDTGGEEFVGDVIVTCRSDTLEQTMSKLLRLRSDLEDHWLAGGEAIVFQRAKVEHVVFDTRCGDKLD